MKLTKEQEVRAKDYLNHLQQLPKKEKLTVEQQKSVDWTAAVSSAVLEDMPIGQGVICNLETQEMKVA